MQPEQVDTIKGIRESSARLIVEVEPQNTAEWDALEKLMEVHKQLRRIDLTKLGQLSLLPQELVSKPREPVTCPMCNGSKQVVEESPDADGSGNVNLVHVDCPKCRGTGTIPAGQATLDAVLEATGGERGADGQHPTEEETAKDEVQEAADEAFATMGEERDQLQSQEDAAKSGPVDISKLRVRVGQEGGRHLIHLNGVSQEGKQLRATLVKLFQKLNLLERADQLETVLDAFPDSDGKKIAVAIAGGTYKPEPVNVGALIDQET